MSGARDDAALAARRRHPCMRTPVGAAAVRRRVAAVIAPLGAGHPEVAASVLAVRGVSGLAPDAFARRAGIDAEVLRRAEAGEISRDQLPGALRRMVPRDPA